MVKNPLKVTLDSNILISAYVFRGKPERVLSLISEEKIIGVISLSLIAEVTEVLAKKFHVIEDDILEIEEEIKGSFELVYPIKTINVARDTDDNRVLEAAYEGKCDYIVTGDKDLLDIRKYKGIKILKPADFLLEISSN